jgi:hypothetical protein
VCFLSLHVGLALLDQSLAWHFVLVLSLSVLRTAASPIRLRHRRVLIMGKSEIGYLDTD